MVVGRKIKIASPALLKRAVLKPKVRRRPISEVLRIVKAKGNGNTELYKMAIAELRLRRSNGTYFGPIPKMPKTLNIQEVIPKYKKKK